MAASVATFDDTMVDMTYEVSEREIYNDIRSEVTEMKTRMTDDWSDEEVTAYYYANNFFFTESFRLQISASRVCMRIFLNTALDTVNLSNSGKLLVRFFLNILGIF